MMRRDDCEYSPNDDAVIDDCDMGAQRVGTKCLESGILICSMPVGTGCAICCVNGCFREEAPNEK